MWPYDTNNEHASRKGSRKGSVWEGKRCKLHSEDEIASQKAHGDHRELSGCCTECMKHSSVQRDCFCQPNHLSADDRIGMCPGVSSRTTLTAVACDMVFRALLFNRTLRTIGGVVDGSVENPWVRSAPRGVLGLLDAVVDSCINDRLDVRAVTAKLKQVSALHGGDVCVRENWNSTRSAILGAFLERRDASTERCARRYC